jgi:hypothetical protein
MQGFFVLLQVVQIILTEHINASIIDVKLEILVSRDYIHVRILHT